MNYFEKAIEQCHRRLNDIDTRPDPTKLKSNRLRYEIELEDAQEALESWKNGKPFATGQFMEGLLRAIGFQPLCYISAADRSAAMAAKYLRALRENGFPDNSCDRTVVPLGMCLVGDVPFPDFVATDIIACDRELILFTAMTVQTGAHLCRFDIPLDTNYEAVHYIGEQLEEIIKQAEARFPGMKYDEEQFVRAMEYDGQAIKYLNRTYELRKRIPSPISGQDAFRLPTWPSLHSNPAKVLSYVRGLTEELEERAEKGTGPVRDEKLRVAWLATGPFGSRVFSMLHSKGVSVPWFHFGECMHDFGVAGGGYGDTTEFGRALTPMEELGRTIVHNQWTGRGIEKWVSTVVETCRDLHIDAVVQFLHIGCSVVGGLAKVTRDRLETELGVPTLDVEGRQLDWDQSKEEEFLCNVEEFVDVCIANKEITARKSTTVSGV